MQIDITLDLNRAREEGLSVSVEEAAMCAWKQIREYFSTKQIADFSRGMFLLCYPEIRKAITDGDADITLSLDVPTDRQIDENFFHNRMVSKKHNMRKHRLRFQKE